MQRIACMMRIRPGTEEEYQRRHQQVSPEMLDALRAAGCHNYSIFYSIFRDGLQKMGQKTHGL
jgi:L-rhamnose mutarotase